MDWQLDTAEVRVLGALLEKEISTPEYYPLSLNALVNACNQKSNREPVVAYDDDTVEDALERLRLKGLTSRITGRDSRVPKHEQRFTEKFNLGRREAAILCVLMLRGWQTPGELRGRSERLHQFDDLDEVESTLDHLTEMEFVKKRWAHLLSGDVVVAEEAGEREAAARSGTRVDQLAADLAALRREFEEFKKKFE